MPLSGKSVSGDISEFHKGKTYKKTRKKYGKKKADKQAVAVGLANERRHAKKGHKKNRRMAHR